MMHSLVCDKCQSSKILPSRVRHIHEFLLLWILAPYRCHLCGYRQLKFRFINMDNEEDAKAGRQTRQIRPRH